MYSSIYAESFKDEQHLQAIVIDAQRSSVTLST